MEKQNSLPENIAEVKEQLSGYIDDRIDLLKLKSIEKAGTIVSGASGAVIMAFFGIFVLIFLSAAAALAIGELVGRYSLGFLAIAVFYGIAAFVLFKMRDKLITFPVVEALLKKFYYN